MPQILSDMYNIIDVVKDTKVRIVQTHVEWFCPCPAVGTIGTITRIEQNYITVRFLCPFTDMYGFVWESYHTKNAIQISFVPEQLETVKYLGPRGFNMEYKIKHSKVLSASGLMPIAVKAQAKLIELGYDDKYYLPIHWEDEVIYAVDAETDKTLGIMTFDVMAYRSQLFIKLSFVWKQYRQSGIHTAMYEKAKAIAKERFVSQVQAGVHIDNVAMQRHCKKQGRKELAIIYCEDID